MPVEFNLVMIRIIKTPVLKGFRDFLPEEMKLRNYVLEACKAVFEAYGFVAIETPALEFASTLLGKYGKDTDKLVYTFKDRGDRLVGLRYDLTVPVSRVLAAYNQQIPLPFKRYQIQPVWRQEKPQKGRFREFLQCDIDTFGVSSYLADAEIITIIYQVLKKLGFDDFKINLNSRQVLFELLKETGIKDKKNQLQVLQAVDKLEKQGKDKVKQELKEKGLTLLQIKTLFAKLAKTKPDENLNKLFGFLKSFGVSENFYNFTPSMVRGLDYYTGPIFETTISGLSLGSVTGGGRYDNLVAQLGGPKISATGTTFGIDRLCEAIKEKNLLPQVLKNNLKILVSLFPGLEKENLKLCQALRKENKNAELYLENKPLDKQVKYANQKNIPYVLFQGPDEVKKAELTLKIMQTGEQKKVTLQELLKIL